MCLASAPGPPCVCLNVPSLSVAIIVVESSIHIIHVCCWNPQQSIAKSTCMIFSAFKQPWGACNSYGDPAKEDGDGWHGDGNGMGSLRKVYWNEWTTLKLSSGAPNSKLLSFLLPVCPVIVHQGGIYGIYGANPLPCGCESKLDPWRYLPAINIARGKSPFYRWLPSYKPPCFRRSKKGRRQCTESTDRLEQMLQLAQDLREVGLAPDGKTICQPLGEVLTDLKHQLHPGFLKIKLKCQTPKTP